MNEIKSVLTEALRQENLEIAETNVRKVRGELGSIRNEKQIISEAQKRIADSVKRIKTYESEAPLTAKLLA